MRAEWLWRALEVLLAGWVFAGLYAAATASLGALALVRLPYWATALGDIGVGILLALMVVQLRLLVIEIAAAAVVATAIYGLIMVSPALEAVSYTVRLANIALVQMVPVFFLSLFLGLIGALFGTVINSSVRGVEL